MNSRVVAKVTAIGALAQIAMVTAGHVAPAVQGLYALGGMGISAIAGWTQAHAEPGSWIAAASGGAIAGGLCAVIGIALSWTLGDVPASLLALGTTGSAVTGLIGGLVGKALARR